MDSLLLLGCGAQELLVEESVSSSHHRLPAWQDGTGPAEDGHARIRVPDAAGGGPCNDFDGGPQVKSV